MLPPKMPFPPGTRAMLPASTPKKNGPPPGAFTAPAMAAGPSPFEKRDKAADRKAGIKENSKKDQKLDTKAMGRKKAKK